MRWLAGCLSAAGSIPGEGKTFSILSEFREPVHYTTEIIRAGLQYTRQEALTSLCEVEGVAECTGCPSVSRRHSL